MSYPDDRLESIFQYIVEEYVKTAAPVGSRTVSELYHGRLSPASIRNVMGELEEMGYIEQPHTSAGRVPTSKGFRFYVDRFMNRPGMQGAHTEPMPVSDWDEELTGGDVEDFAQNVSRVLARVAQNAGICYMHGVRRHTYLGEEAPELQDALSEREIFYVNGASHVFEQPEFHDIRKAQSLIRALEFQNSILRLLQRAIEEGKTHVFIGEETESPELRHVGFVARNYSWHGRPVGCIAVLGPVRMHYGRAVNIVDRLAEAVSDHLNEF